MCLEIITVDGNLVRVKNLKAEPSDGNLQVTFNVDMIFMGVVEKDMIEVIESNTKINY